MSSVDIHQDQQDGGQCKSFPQGLPHQPPQAADGQRQKIHGSIWLMAPESASRVVTISLTYYATGWASSYRPTKP